MTWSVNQTHQASLRSWVESANDPATDFPLQNLPFGMFRRGLSPEPARAGVAIGDQILDLAVAGIATCHNHLNPLMALGMDAMHALRLALSELLRYDSPDQSRGAKALVPMAQCELTVPVQIGNYSDFYASVEHASNVGRLFRPDQPLLPNYKYVPIGYHGRASSIVASGTEVRRPCGQTRPSPGDPPQFGPTRKLDYELELGFFVAAGNPLGTPVLVGEAAEQIFGFCLLNDWSARDIQAWEYQPLGPFLAKSFATSVSPWVVTMEALAPFRVPASRRAEGDPPPLPYLTDPSDQEKGGLDIALEVWLQSAQMYRKGQPAIRLSRGNFSGLFWTVAQMLAHHTGNGCNLLTGDLLASGTVSGAAPDARGCLLELTQGGVEPVLLPSGEARQFLEDGDEVILRGRCEREGFAAIGFGECRGKVAAA